MLAPLLRRRPARGEDLLNGVLPCYNLSATQDSRHLAVGALEFKFWKAACGVFGRPDWVQRHWQRGRLPARPTAQPCAPVAQLVASQSRWRCGASASRRRMPA